MAKTLKCNNCGAGDVSRVNEHEFRCNYCQARIVTEQPKFDLNSFFKSFNPNDLHRRTQTTYHTGSTTVKNTSRLGCVIAGIALAGVLAGVLVPLLVLKDAALPGTSAEAKGWKLSYTQQVYYATGSKGPAVWIFQEEQYNWEKNRSVLSIVDPRNGKTLYSRVVVPEHTSGQTVPGTWDLFNGGKVIGDTIFFTPKGKGLEGRNIYSAEKVIGQEYFVRKTGSELAEAYAYSSTPENYLRVKSDEGTEYYYFPGKDSLLLRDVYYRNRNSKEKVYRYFFLLSGNTDKKYVLRTQQLVFKNDETGSFYHTYRDYLREKKYYERYYNIKSIDSIPVSHGFFNAEFIAHTDTSFVIKYKTGVKEDSPLVVGAFDLSGKNLWKIIPEQLGLFKPVKTGDRVSFTLYNVNGRLMITSNAPRAACCINLQTGKTEWTHRLEK